MLIDLVKKFNLELEENPSLFLDNYELKQGLYLRINVDLSWNENMKTIKDRTMIVDKNTKDEAFDHPLSKWFKVRDANASVMNDLANKFIDVPSKAIHSCVPFAFFMKQDLLTGKKMNKGFGNTPQENLNHYKNVVAKMSRETILEKIRTLFKTKETGGLELFKENYLDLYDYLVDEKRSERIARIISFMEREFNSIVDYIESESQHFTNYVKLYFDFNEPLKEEEWENEYKLYAIPKLFTVNDYNQVLNGRLQGLAPFNLTMNSKKPFFEFKSMKTLVPIRVTLEEATVRNQLARWITTQGKFQTHRLAYTKPFSFNRESSRIESQYYVRLNGDAEVMYYDNVPFKETENVNIQIKNVMGISSKEDPSFEEKDYIIHKRSDLEAKVSQLFYFGNLYAFYFYSKDEQNTRLKGMNRTIENLLYESRDAWYDYFHKGISQSISGLISRNTQGLMEEQIKREVQGLQLHRMREAFNVRFALLKEMGVKGGESMGDRTTVIKNRLDDLLHTRGDAAITTDEEFYFIVGQLSYYLLYQSEAKSKTLGLFEPILAPKKARRLKEQLEGLFERYNHAIRLDNHRFKTAYEMVLGYDPEQPPTGEMRDFLLAGILANNLLFFKKKENLEDEGEVS